MFSIENELDYELVVTKSRFIACVRKIQNNEDFEKTISSIKTKYKDAKHYPFAFILDNNKRCSDDKEPQNTAGLPILSVLEKKNLNRVLIVVVRYFGGTLLGAGNLTRTYRKTVVEALKRVNYKELIEVQDITLIFAYSNQKDIDYILDGANVYKKEFKENITYNVYINIEHSQEIIARIKENKNVTIQIKDTLLTEK